MNEELNLVEILKNVPKGTKFYSSAYGYVFLNSINLEGGLILVLDDLGNTIPLTQKGTLYKNIGECIIFPSQTQRDWSKFKVDLQEGTKVMCAEVDTGWMLRYYASDSRCYQDGKRYGKTVEWTYIVPVSDFDFTNPESNINKSI